ncbi:NADH-quinone oxidoreductase subunit C [Desulfurobacterium atlanticum]|uniref:NADH-quinone oxidoreductase n=1 Tax=Desulfurobacterium atlanticum TaxID=240169 RepID=A0A238YYW7_9BACT|nr:NADH-quinone oxidoreductase subunit C [Desulfurobacterium atlanticum]SNR75941.1 NADH-quinone oxidoreductase subunit C [Desulfurobacterium atlanticum]
MELFKGLDIKVIEDEKLKGSKHQIVASPEIIREIAVRFKENDYFLEDIMAMEFKECFHLLYRFNHFKTPGTITVRVSIEKDPAEIETISDIYQGALWHEREVFEFFGITFKNHPDLKPLLLPAEDFEGYPLRKSEKTVKSIKDVFPMLFDETDQEEEQS